MAHGRYPLPSAGEARPREGESGGYRKRTADDEREELSEPGDIQQVISSGHSETKGVPGMFPGCFTYLHYQETCRLSHDAQAVGYTATARSHPLPRHAPHGRADRGHRKTTFPSLNRKSCTGTQGDNQDNHYCRHSENEGVVRAFYHARGVPPPPTKKEHRCAVSLQAGKVSRGSHSTVAPPNFSLTKSPVSKPAPGRASWKYGAPLPPLRDRSIVLPKQEKICGDFVLTEPFLVSISHETFVKENPWFCLWGGYRRIGRGVAGTPFSSPGFRHSHH